MAVEESIDPKGLKKHLKISKRAPVAFAFCVGGEPSEHYVLMDRKPNKANTLRRDVQNAGTSAKIAFGTMRKKLRVLELTCQNNKTVAGLAKVVKKWLKFQKVTMNVVILDGEGNELESDIEDEITNLPPDPELDLDDDDDAEFDAGDADDAEEDEPAAGADPQEDEEAEEADDAPAPAPAEDPLRAKWEAVADRLGQAVSRVLGQGLIDDRKLDALWTFARTKAGAGDFRAALQAVGPIRELIEAAKTARAEAAAAPPPSPPPPPPMPDHPLKGKWDAAAEKVAPRVTALGTPEPGSRAAQIVADWAACEDHAGAGEFKDALIGLKSVAEGLKALGAAAGQPDEIAELRKRLTGLVDQAKTAIAEAPGRKAELAALVKGATGHLADRAAPEARAALDALEAALAIPAAPPPPPPPPPPQPPGAAGAEDAAEAAEEDDTRTVDTRALARDVREIWDEASGRVDRQLDALLAQIRSDPSEEAGMVEDLGLSAWSEGARTRLMAAIVQLNMIPPAKFDDRARKATVQAFRGYADFLRTHPAVEAMEANPFGVKVELSTALVSALRDMEKAVLDA